jgi:predicted aminopeptidase
MKRLLRHVFFKGLGLCLLTSCYLSKQAYRQVGLLYDREPVNAVLANGNVPEGERRKLAFAKEALKFAANQGLKVDGAYQQYVRLDGQALTYTVQAAKPFEMRLKTWWFPIVGSVPYLGYFDREDREFEATKLEEQGYEVHRGGAAAFSSLGWFSDPIYSSMLRRTETELAHLFFHELTHRTLWLRDGVEFNENLAEYIGARLTSEFFEAMGRHAELAEFEQINADYAAVRPWIRQLREELTKNFKDTEGQPTVERVLAKNKIISLAMIKKPMFKRMDFVGKEPWNNARILAASHYAPDTELFDRAAKCLKARLGQVNAGTYLKALEKQAETTSTGFEALQKMCG